MVKVDGPPEVPGSSLGAKGGSKTNRMSKFKEKKETMNNLTRKIATTGLAFVIVAGLSFTPAQAQTTAELQAQIANLLAQITALQAQLSAAGGSTSTGSSYNFTRNLTIGSRGEDVKALQEYLNAQGFTVAASGAGSPGNETEYFGSLTQAALADFQAANSVSPAVGYFGPITRAKIDSLSATTGGGTTGGGTTGGGTPSVVPAGTDLLVEKASDSPGERTIGSGTAFNPALKIKLSAGSKAVSVTAITLQKGGFLANTNLNGVDIVDASGMRHGQVVTSINADNTVRIGMSSNPITVAAGTSQTIMLRFNLLTGNYTGTVSFGINSVSAIEADTTAISGAFPITGAAMNIVNGGSSLASTTLDVQTTTGSSTLNVDADSLQEITKFRIQESASNEGVYLHSLTLYNYGNADDTDYSDVTLEAQDGTVLATTQPNGQYVTFNLGTPYFIDKGLTRDFTVKAKLVDGASKTINLVVYNNYDIDLRGASTDVSVIPGAGSNDSSFPIGNGFNTQTIGSGSMTLTRSIDSPSTAVAPGSTSVVLAKFKAKPTGENYELRQVSFYIATSSSGVDLTGTVYVKVNDAIVYSTAASSISNTAATTYTLSSYPILTSGQDNIITVEGSISSSATSASNYTVTSFDLIQAKRLVTNDLVDPGVSAVSGLQIAVNAASLKVTTLSVPVSNSVVIGTNGHEYARIELSAEGSGENVKVSKIVVDHVEGSNLTEVGNLLIYKDNEEDPLATTASTATNASTVTFNFSNPIVVTKTTPVTLHLKADALSGSNDHTYRITSSTSAVTAVGATTGNSLTSGSDVTFAGNGQAQTHVASGNLSLSLVSGSGASPSQNQVVSVGTSGATVFAFKMTSQYEEQKVTSLKLTATTTGGGNISTTTVRNIRLYAGSSATPFATKAQFDTCDDSKCEVTFTDDDNILDDPVPTTGTTVYVKADVADPNQSGQRPVLGNNFKFQITSSTGDVAVKGAVTASTVGTVTGTPTASGITYVVPHNVSIEAVSPTTATQVGTGSGQTVGIFKVSNNGQAAIRLASSSTAFSFSNGGSASTSLTFSLYSSNGCTTQGDASVTYITTSTAYGTSTTIPFDMTYVSAANRKIEGNSCRYITVRTNGAAANNNTFQLSVSALGNVLFEVDEADLGYSGNADTDLTDTITGLYVNGTPSLATITAKD